MKGNEGELKKKTIELRKMTNALNEKTSLARPVSIFLP